MDRALHVLMVVSAPETARKLSGVLDKAGLDTQWTRVDTLRALTSSLGERAWDLVLCEERPGRMDAVNVIGQVRRRHPAVPVVVLMKRLIGRRVIRLFREGASDCILIAGAAGMGQEIRRALEEARTAGPGGSPEQGVIGYQDYLEDLVTARTDQLRKLNEQLQAEIGLHRATVRALRINEAAFRAVAENAPDIIARFNRDLRHLYVNPAVEHVTGRSREDFLGKSLRELDMPEDLCRMWEDLAHGVFGSKEVRSGHFELPLPEGKKVFHVRLAPEFSTGNEVTSVVAVARDVTDARQTLAVLRRSESSFKNLAENAPLTIIRLTRDLNLVYANPASRVLTCLSPEEAIGKSFEELGLPGRVGRKVAGLIERVFRSARTENSKVEFKVCGEMHAFEIALVPELSETGYVGTALMIAHDTTEAEIAHRLLLRHKAEIERQGEKRAEELLESRTRLRHAKRLSEVGILAATVAHELRNPLAVIQTAVYNVRRKRENPKVEKHLVAIEKKVAESNQIINNLLNYSRLKEPRVKASSIFNIIKDALAASSARFPGSKAVIVEDISSIRGRRFEVDPAQMKEVFVNILNNAHQTLDGAPGTISVKARRKANKLIISFSDDGAGMTEDVLKRAEEPFFTTRSKGTGLGLTICRDIVRLHGGSLAVESIEGVGATITVMLPV
jgi:PAS domain S-box-containing protein